MLRIATDAAVTTTKVVPVITTIIIIITEPLNLAYHLYGNLNMMCHSLIGYTVGFMYVSFQGMMQDDKEI